MKTKLKEHKEMIERAISEEIEIIDNISATSKRFDINYYPYANMIDITSKTGKECNIAIDLSELKNNN